MSRATTYSEAELAAMMVDVESDLVERKESFGGDAPNAVRQAICAFANDFRGTTGQASSLSGFATTVAMPSWKSTTPCYRGSRSADPMATFCRPLA